MAHDTSAINKQRQDLSQHESVWLFGYGSLIYKVDFPFLAKQPAYINDWSRRFWQGSHDHRGTPEQPGRVLTLIKTPGERCTGMAYKVSPEVFDHLDHREKNGYLRFFTPMFMADGSSEQGLVYIATDDNAAFLGDASDYDIAQHIARSKGPSGDNSEYLLKLSDGLKELGVTDPHVEGIRRHLETML